MRVVQKQLGLQESRIVDVCKGNRKTTGEYQWRYEDENLEFIKPVSPPSNKRKKVAQYTINGELIAIHESFKEAARAVDGTASAISRICAGYPGLHTHKNYCWKIVDEIVQYE